MRFELLLQRFHELDPLSEYLSQALSSHYVKNTP